MTCRNISVERAYHILGVGKGDSWDVIRAKYKRLLLQNHPDKTAHDGCHDDFVLIQESFKCLKEHHKSRGTSCQSKDTPSLSSWKSYGLLAKNMIFGSLPHEMREMVQTISSHVASFATQTTLLDYSSIDTWSQLLSQYSPSVVQTLWNIVQSNQEKYTCVAIPCHCGDIVTRSTIDVTCRRKNKLGTMEKVRCSLPLGNQEFFVFAGRGDWNDKTESYRDMAVMVELVEKDWISVEYDSRTLVIDSTSHREHIDSIIPPKHIRNALVQAMKSLCENDSFQSIVIEPIWESFHIRVRRHQNKTT